MIGSPGRGRPQVLGPNLGPRGDAHRQEALDVVAVQDLPDGLVDGPALAQLTPVQSGLEVDQLHFGLLQRRLPGLGIECHLLGTADPDDPVALAGARRAVGRRAVCAGQRIDQEG